MVLFGPRSRTLKEAKMSSPRRLHVGFVGILFLLSLLAACDSNRSPLTPLPVKISRNDAPTDGVAGLAPSADVASATTLGGPIGGLDAASLAHFAAGQAEFQDVESIDDGLGPVFNEASCAACHNAPLGGTTGR